VGYLEAGLTTSPEMIVFTSEMIDMHRRFMAGVEISDETLALDVIHEVGPGGDFIATEHTMQHFREDWYPTLFERRRYGQWQAAGAQRMEDRLRDKTVDIIDAHVPPALPESVRTEIAQIKREAAYA
jgi:trimethylamine--corrinoid protein Co-methyltransferase